MGTDDEQRDDSEGTGHRPDDAWIERVVDIAGSLGFNKVRLRWKLIRWQEQRRRTARRREQTIAHITYAHKTCPECGAVQDRAEPICTRCSAKLGSRGVQVLRRIGLVAPVPKSMSTLLGLVLVIAYARVWIAAGGGLAGPSGQLLVDFGGRWPPAIADEPWRLVTACLLHAGLVHLAFNLIAIGTVGPRIEELYGRATMLALFIITGTLANLATLQVGSIGVGIGASGGLMGLIGATAVAGHRIGTSHGRAVRDAMLQWCAYVFVFGFVTHADNWAHLFGLVGGAGFGLLVSPQTWQRRSLRWLRAIAGGVGLVATLGGLAIILTRTPSPPPPPREATEATELTNTAALASFDQLVTACTKLYAGDTAGALAIARAQADAPVDGAPAVDVRAEEVASMCDLMQQFRDTCEHDTPERPGQMCEVYRPGFAHLPVHAYQRHDFRGEAAR